MTSNISAIIIDPLKREHDYNLLDREKNSDSGFDILVLDKPDHIQEYIAKYNIPDCIITIGLDDYSALSSLPFEVRKHWCDISEFNAAHIQLLIFGNLTGNLNRENEDSPLFSCFTCIHNTPQEDFFRLYNSLKEQTYNNWNWWILDDSSNGYDISFITKLHDFRIHILKNVTNHGVIGFNKHTIAMACDGDYLVEIDHDDKLTPDCLAVLKDAFDQYPDAGYAYSDALELIAPETSVDYGDNFAFGEGIYKTEFVDGLYYTIACEPGINAKTIRGIYGQPNHVRCWRKDFYHRIGGHNKILSVCDDMDLNVRSFLETRIIHINKVLYIQYEYGRFSENKSNTQALRFNEIQRTNWLLYELYDQSIHQRILDLGYSDEIWVNDHSVLDKKTETPLQILSYEYKKTED